MLSLLYTRYYREHALDRAGKTFLFLIVVLLAGPALRSAAGGEPPALGEKGPDADAIRSLVEESGSPLFLVRKEARKKLKSLGREILPFLVVGLGSGNPRVATSCLGLLDDAVADSRYNDAVKDLLAGGTTETAAAAARYLAGHPDPGDGDYEGWSRDLLERGPLSSRRAFLEGVRWPAPAFQADLILSALPLLPRALALPAVRAISRAERSRAAAGLAECSLLVRRGILDEKILPAIFEALADCAAPAAEDAVMEGLFAPRTLVREKAGTAARALETHLYRSRRYQELIALKRRLCRLFPENAEWALDLADSLLLYGPPGDAAPLLEATLARTEGEEGTRAMIEAAEARAGLALAAFRSGGEWKPFLEGPAKDLEETPGDYTAEERARLLLLEGALETAAGGDGTPFFEEALDAAPYDPERARIDECLSGRFGVSGLLWRLSRDGREEDCLKVFDGLIGVFEKDPAHCDYCPAPGSPDLTEDRARSALPLSLGLFRLNDMGDPAGAVAVLDRFIAVMRESSLDVNLDPAARAFFARSAAKLDLGDLEGARSDALRGIKICEDLLSGYRDALEKEGRRIFLELIRGEKRSKALGLLQLATVNTIGRGPLGRTGVLVREALGLAPELVSVQAARALTLVREGEGKPAERIMAAVEDYPDQFYNKACFFLLLGRKDEALYYLKRHFSEALRPRARKVARLYAASDPDLEPLREDPAFLEIIGEDE